MKDESPHARNDTCLAKSLGVLVNNWDYGYSRPENSFQAHTSLLFREIRISVTIL